MFFLQRKTEQSELCSDVEEQNGLDAHAPQALTRKKAVVSQRRYEGVYNRIADVSVPFCDKGGTRKRADVFSCKDKRSKAKFAPTWNSRIF